MSEHTPGPWEHKPCANDGGLIRARADKATRPSGWKGVASVHGQEDDDESAANVKLIAAAPDLLAACEFTLNLLRDLLTSDFQKKEDEPARVALAAAIAKAKGEV